MKHLCGFMMVLFLSQTIIFASNIDDFEIMTEIFPPYNMQKDGQLEGISVDLLEQILIKINAKTKVEDIKLYPWARAYEQLLQNPNTLLFSMFRTPFREEEFKWVGPIDESLIGLIARKDRSITIDSIEDLKAYRIGTVNNDIAEQLLLEKGFDKSSLDSLSGTNALSMSVNKLNKNRIDLFAYITTYRHWQIDASSFRPNEYETVYVLDVKELYYAFHKDTDDKLIALLQNALDELKKNGVYDQIIQKYKN